MTAILLPEEAAVLPSLGALVAPGIEPTLHSMKTRHPFQLALVLLVGCGTALSNRAIARAEEIAAVSSKVSDDYVRTKLADGSFQPESYAFGKGGYWSGALRDKTIDEMNFMDVARTIAGPLERQGYLPTKDPETTKFLIMVYWGTTQAPEHANETNAFRNTRQARADIDKARLLGSPAEMAAAEAAFTSAFAALQAENTRRDRANVLNAQMLGYDSWWGATARFEGTPFDSRWQEMVNELEKNRYFVVLMAYDFQLMWKQKKTKLVWETRFSIGEQRNRFDQQLVAMALEASKYFGQDSHGLVRKAIPEGKVVVGEVKSLGVVGAKAP
jgi:hypothetical protein